MKIRVAKRVLDSNDQQARRNIDRLAELKLAAVNVLASPGAGKTCLIAALLKRFPQGLSVGVIEGDVAGRIDTDKILALGFPATQINTDGGCHLDATMIAKAVDSLGVKGPGCLFIENIGNLICPAQFDLGEGLRMVVASVPEGDDKPLKYPGVFASADAVVLNKIDLLGHVEFKTDSFVAGVRTLSPDAPIFNVSCRTGQGLDAVMEWLLNRPSLRFQ